MRLGINLEKTIDADRWTHEELNDCVEFIKSAFTDLEYAIRESSDELFYRSANIDVIEDLEYISGQLLANAHDSILIRQTHNTKYVPEMTLRLDAPADRISFEVLDNGIGIDPRVEPYLFTDLKKANIPEDVKKSRLKRKIFLQGGQGIGLYQTKTTIEELGGDIHYLSRGRNEGAIFWYEVPLIGLIR